jgi:hypothetical protein
LGNRKTEDLMAKKTKTETDRLDAPYGKAAEVRDKTLAIRMTETTQKKITALLAAHECSAGVLFEKLVDLELERLRREEGRVWEGDKLIRAGKPTSMSLLAMEPESKVGLVSRTPGAIAEELESIAGEIRRRARNA